MTRFSLYNNKRGDKYSDMQCPKCSTQMAANAEGTIATR